MSDILDAAQKQINDAANKLTPPAAAGGAPPPADPTPPAPPSQPDPAPTPPPAGGPAAPPAPEPEPAKPPEPVASEPTPEESAFVDKLIHQTSTVSVPAAAEPPAPLPPSPEPIPPAETPPVPPAPPLKPKKKGTGRGAMIAAILLLLFALPMGVFFVSQQQKQLADTRSRATEDCKFASSCSSNALSCTTCPGYTYRASTRQCCRTVVISTPTPTQKPIASCEDCVTQRGSRSECAAWCTVAPTPTPAITSCESCVTQRGSRSECSAWCIPTPTPTPTPKPEDCQPGEFRHDSRSRDVVEEDCRIRCNTDSCVGTIYQKGTYPNFFWCYKCQGTGGGVISTPTPTPPPTGGQCPSAKIAENCAIYECPGGCSFYNNGALPECRTFARKVPCSQAAASGCGQVDYLDDNGNYCGVKPGTQCTNGTNSCGGGEPTPTTPPQVLQCRAISIYKNGEKVTDYSTLKSGDTVILAVKGDNATKGRFRVNGAPPTFEESTGTNANGEFTFPFTIPSDVPNNSITIEAEVFQNGVWK